MRIAFIQAEWHKDIVEQAQFGFRDELTQQGGGDAELEIVNVPGALEIPLHAQRLAQHGRLDASSQPHSWSTAGSIDTSSLRPRFSMRS